MPGYRNKVIKLDFPDLSADWDTDPIWVIIRNPRLMPAKEITSATDTSGAYDQDGKIADRAKAEQATDKLIAKLVVAARVYDAAAEVTFDPLTGEITSGDDQPLMPGTPWSPETAAKLPMGIRIRIAEEFTAAQNPPAGPTQKTSSGPPSPSSTAPGAAGTPLPS